jgi:hypothetical protein
LGDLALKQEREAAEMLASSTLSSDSRTSSHVFNFARSALLSPRSRRPPTPSMASPLSLSLPVDLPAADGRPDELR